MDDAREVLRKLKKIRDKETLNCLDISELLCGLSQSKKLNAAAIAKLVGVNAASVRHYKRLTSLHPEVKTLVRGGRLSFGHAKVLASLPEGVQVELAKKAVWGAWSVRRLENAAKNGEQKAAPAPKPDDAYYDQLNTEISESAGFPAKVTAHSNGRPGTVSFEYADLEQFEWLMSRLNIRLASMQEREFEY